MRKLKVYVNGVSYTVEFEEEGVVYAVAPPAVSPAAAAEPAISSQVNETQAITSVATSTPAAVAEIGAGDTPINAPMPGKVTKILKKPGDKIAKGECIMILEAMKMQNEIGSPISGVIKSINVNKGDAVKPGLVMAVLSNG